MTIDATSNRYGSRRLERACPNHFWNIASVSIISVKPAWLIFTVETGLGLTIAHGIVGILERQADKRFQIGRNQIVLAPHFVPRRDPGWILLHQRQRLGLARLHVERIRDRR